MCAMTDEDWKALQERLSRSAFRSRFHLSAEDKDYVLKKGMDVIGAHASDFVDKRLRPRSPVNDGKQTPMKGHPVFIAQHATGCCCRSCLEKWHGIPMGRTLTDAETAYVVSVLMTWLHEHASGVENLPCTPDLFE